MAFNAHIILTDINNYVGIAIIAQDNLFENHNKQWMMWRERHNERPRKLAIARCYSPAQRSIDNVESY